MDASSPADRKNPPAHRGDARRVAVDILAHLDSAHNLASWLVGNEHEAQDIVQEAYLRAIRSTSTYRGGDLRSWILAIVRNACFDSLRRGKAHPMDDLSDDPQISADDDQSDPAKILQRAENVREIQSAISQLSAPLREVVVLREMEGLSYKEIAAVVGFPIGTVMSRLARARWRLAQLLSGETQGVAQRPKE
ncbi:MAG: sigma-70 family RNA polymerase sigma factor [Tepidisphaeraceae bacterium]